VNSILLNGPASRVQRSDSSTREIPIIDKRHITIAEICITKLSSGDDTWMRPPRGNTSLPLYNDDRGDNGIKVVVEYEDQ